MSKREIWSGLTVNGKIISVRKDTELWTVEDFENNIDLIYWPEGHYDVVEVSVRKINKKHPGNKRKKK
jgi:hypothetical protein